MDPNVIFRRNNRHISNVMFETNTTVWFFDLKHFMLGPNLYCKYHLFAVGYPKKSQTVDERNTKHDSETTTVDGSEIRLTSWYGKDPIIYRVVWIPGGDRRISEPSTVSTWASKSWGAGWSWGALGLVGPRNQLFQWGEITPQT